MACLFSVAWNYSTIALSFLTSQRFYPIINHLTGGQRLPSRFPRYEQLSDVR